MGVCVSAMGIVANGLSCHLAHYNSASCKYAHQLKLKPQPATAVQRWMKRAWFQRIRGGGCQTLVYGGKTHVLPHLFVCHLSCSPTSITTWFCCWGGVTAGSWGSYGGGCCRLSSFAHMTTPPMTVRYSSCTSPIGSYSSRKGQCCLENALFPWWSIHAWIGGLFVPHGGESHPHA